jgi:hypothetical protein
MGFLIVLLLSIALILYINKSHNSEVSGEHANNPMFHDVPLFNDETWMATLDGETFLGNYPQDVMNGFMSQLVEKLDDGVYYIGNAAVFRKGNTVVVKHYDKRGGLEQFAKQLETLAGL